MILMAELSKYRGMVFARNEEVAGAISEGFMTTTFPAAIAPINGSNANSNNQQNKITRVSKMFPCITELQIRLASSICK